MNRALLKEDAKNAMRTANPHPVLTTLVFLTVQLAAQIVLSVVAFIFAFSSIGIAVTALISNSYGYYSDTYAPVSAAGAIIYFIAAVVVALLVGTIQFGYFVYSLKIFKQEETGVGELFGYFPMLLKIFGLTLWMGLFIFLWSCLCYIPGIIAALRYSQAFFILAENPDKSIRECVNESKMMMSGRLWEYFVLQLSFILWYLLSAVTCGIASLYVMPYVTITNAGYYLSLKPEDTYQNYEGYQGGQGNFV
ncbi:MAG: DUF975 family protein [Eubacteriales bacterium]|nr:DUF975 family protein [Eubacteriales bacterium]